jgi:cell division protease FtsH
MNTLMKNFTLVVLVFLAVSAFFSLFDIAPEAERISINQLVEKINSGQIEKIVVSGEEVQVTYKEDGKGITRKESESSLSESLLNYGVNQEALSNIDVTVEEVTDLWVWLNPLLFSVLPLIIFGFFFWSIFKNSKNSSMKAFSFTKNKAELFQSKKAKKTTFDDVAGLKEVKTELKEVVDFLKNPDKYLKMGAEIPRGVLLIGSPGTGKTLLARAIAGEAGVPFFHTSGSSFVELFVGTGAARVRDLFKVAKKNTPCIVFIDEIDAVGRMRGAGIGGGHDEREQTLNQLLKEMDGFARETNVIVMGATNRPDVLDKALLRPGRFDRRISFSLPDIQDREAILKLHFQGKPGADDVKLREVAERTPGFSGADLENIVNEAAILAASKEQKKIYQQNLLDSIEKVLLGPEQRSRVISEKEKEIAAYHEAGHAIVSSTLLESQPVRKISIISRANGAGGYVLKTPKEERSMRTKSEFLNSIATALGGYCAEKIKYGEVTTGASSDLKKASQLAKKLVKVYGMSSLGPLSFGNQKETVFLGKEISEERDYSEETAALIDKEVKKFIEDSYKEAEKVLKKKKKLLEKLAQTLIKKETIEREEFEEIIGKKKKTSEEKKEKGKKNKEKEEDSKKESKKSGKKESKKERNFKIKIKDL